MEHLFKDDLLFVPRYSNYFSCHACHCRTIFKSKTNILTNSKDKIKVLTLTCTKCNYYTYSFLPSTIDRLAPNFYLKDDPCVLLIKETPKHLD